MYPLEPLTEIFRTLIFHGTNHLVPDSISEFDLKFAEIHIKIRKLLRERCGQQQ
jgi:hypothetical protein